MLYFVHEKQCKNHRKQSPAEEPGWEKVVVCKANLGDCDAALWVRVLVHLLVFGISHHFWFLHH